MIVKALSRGDRRALAWGVAAIATLLGGSRAVREWRSWDREARAAAVERIIEAEQAEASVRELRETVDSLEQRKERLVALAPALLDTESPGAAAAALASLVSSTAASAGLQVQAIQVAADSAGTVMFPRVSARADLIGDIHGLAALLQALERGPTLLSIRQLSITQPEPGAPSTRPEELRVQVRVVGLTFNRQRGDGQ